MLRPCTNTEVLRPGPSTTLSGIILLIGASGENRVITPSPSCFPDVHSGNCRRRDTRYFEVPLLPRSIFHLTALYQISGDSDEIAVRGVKAYVFITERERSFSMSQHGGRIISSCRIKGRYPHSRLGKKRWNLALWRRWSYMRSGSIQPGFSHPEVMPWSNQCQPVREVRSGRRIPPVKGLPSALHNLRSPA